MKRAVWVILPVLLASVLLGLGACTGPRVHPLTDFQYAPKGPDAPIGLLVGKESTPYEAIAVVDSETYAKKDDATKEKMLEDLRKRARKMGADAVQDIRLLPVNVRGVTSDEDVPVPGAWKQGRYQLYFLRGEAIKYVERVGATGGEAAPSPSASPTATVSTGAPTQEAKTGQTGERALSEIQQEHAAPGALIGPAAVPPPMPQATASGVTSTTLQSGVTSTTLQRFPVAGERKYTPPAHPNRHRTGKKGKSKAKPLSQLH